MNTAYIQPSYAIISYMRSGRHITQELLSKYNFIFKGEFAKCNVGDVLISHTIGDALKCKKSLILYRKDPVEQIFAAIRLLYYEKIKGGPLVTMEEHSSCHDCNELDLKKYTDKIHEYYNIYTAFIRLINSSNPNMLVIDYDSIVNRPIDHFKDILHFFDYNYIDIDRLSKDVQSMNIGYIHTITPERYTELKGILDSFEETEPSIPSY